MIKYIFETKVAIDQNGDIIVLEDKLKSGDESKKSKVEIEYDEKEGYSTNFEGLRLDDLCAFDGPEAMGNINKRPYKKLGLNKGLFDAILIWEEEGDSEGTVQCKHKFESFSLLYSF